MPAVARHLLPDDLGYKSPGSLVDRCEMSMRLGTVENWCILLLIDKTLRSYTFEVPDGCMKKLLDILMHSS